MISEYLKRVNEELWVVKEEWDLIEMKALMLDYEIKFYETISGGRSIVLTKGKFIITIVFEYRGNRVSYRITTNDSTEENLIIFGRSAVDKVRKIEKIINELL